MPPGGNQTAHSTASLLERVQVTHKTVTWTRHTRLMHTQLAIYRQNRQQPLYNPTQPGSRACTAHHGSLQKLPSITEQQRCCMLLHPLQCCSLKIQDPATKAPVYCFLSVQLSAAASAAAETCRACDIRHTINNCTEGSVIPPALAGLHTAHIRRLQVQAARQPAPSHVQPVCTGHTDHASTA